MLDNVRHYSSVHSLGLNANTEFILATIHRNFNTDIPERLTNILSALNDISELFHTEILFPLHPRTRKAIDSMNLTYNTNHIRFIEPRSPERDQF